MLRSQWMRTLAEQSLANNAEPVPMRAIPDRQWPLFALNQKATTIHNGMICLPLEEFVRIASCIQSNAIQLITSAN